MVRLCCYFLAFALALVLSACCGDQPIPIREQIDVSFVQQQLPGYFSLTKLQTPLQGQPLSVNSSDLNNDGSPDLISGYTSDLGGLLMIQHGKVNFTDSPFNSAAQMMEVPLRPDYIFNGDFNDDRLPDILIAQKENSYLYWIDGKSQNFSAGNLVPLPGTITAISVAQLDRETGKKDTILGLQTNDGFQLIVYKGNTKNPFTEPEIYGFDNRIDVLEVGMLNQDSANDLAIVSAAKLWILMGNPKLTSTIERKPKLIRLRFPVEKMAFGNFVPESRKGLALLSKSGKIHSLTFDNESHWQKKVIARGAWPQASQMLRTRMTGNPMDDLVIITGKQVELIATSKAGDIYQSVSSIELSGDSASAMSVKLNSDALYDLVFLENQNPITIALTQPQSFFSVNLLTDESDADTGDGLCDIDLGTPNHQCTFRAAIQQANASPGMDSIRFDSLSSATIAPLTPLPTITDAVDINGSLFITGAAELTGSNPAAAISPGLTITAGSSVVRHFVINKFDGSALSAGIYLATTGNNEIYDCKIGTDSTGTIDLGNAYGVLINGSSNNELSNLVFPNTMSGNITGVAIQGNSGGNQIEYNLIGTTADGSAALGNLSDGIYVSTTAGNTNFINNNVVSGNNGNGIRILSEGYLNGNKVGVDAEGINDLGNAGIGISTVSDSNYLTHNEIGGNGSAGVSILGDDNHLDSNYIGVNQEGTVDVGNDAGGILIQAGDHNWLNDNVIAFNNGFQAPGIRVTAGGIENFFETNSIYSNSGLGINLGSDEVTPNDPGDGDNGENHLQNFPIITSATSNGTDTGVAGTLNSTPNDIFQLEFFGGPDCDPSGNGEGQIYLGSTSVNSDANGNAEFSATFFLGLPLGYFVTATASKFISSNPSIYETSEFSACILVQAPESGLSCSISSYPFDPMPGENVIAIGTIRDENNVPVPDLPVIFRIQTPYGENFDSAITNAQGNAQTPPFTSNYPDEYTISMEGTGFSCSTSVQFTYCQSEETLDRALALFTEDGEELLKIKIADPVLDRLTEQTYRELLPQLSEFRKIGKIHLNGAKRDSVISLLDLYMQKATPALGEKLLQLRKTISER
jgi:hypothetical protein